MAFTGVIPSKTLPESVEGIYFFPYTWFRYGIHHNLLEISDLRKFSQSLQGSVISYVESWLAQNYPDQVDVDYRAIDKGGHVADMWLLFKPGQSEVNMYYILNKSKAVQISAPTTKSGSVYVCSLETLKSLNINDQKTVNNSIIQQFAGCGVTMKDSVWFFDADKIFRFD
jgi:hypothetical protein